MQFNGNGNYILDNCSFYNVNATNSHQSVVYLNLGEGIIENCNFTKCTTSFGTVTNHNAASTTNVHMVVRNCNFEDNYATTEPGAINNCGQLEVYNLISHVMVHIGGLEQFILIIEQTLLL